MVLPPETSFDTSSISLQTSQTVNILRQFRPSFELVQFPKYCLLLKQMIVQYRPFSFRWLSGNPNRDNKLSVSKQVTVTAHSAVNLLSCKSY